ncbi:MAG TPA: trigger factor, partial [bacterium]|nr:trigger factor [bacterium]
IAVPSKPVTDADIDEQMKLLRERKATLVPMLEDRALVKGDFAVIDYETFIEGNAASEGKTEDTTIKVGDDSLLDEFEASLPGMKVNETRAVEVQFPADHASEKLRGKKVLYRVTLKDIKKQELPEVTEEFAKEVGADSIEDLKKKIREELEQHRTDERKREVRNKILDAILGKTTMDVPPAMLDRQLQALYQSAQQVLGESGKVLDRGGFDSLRDGLKTQAERRVKELLVLEAISRVENLQVTEVDLNNQFESVAQRYNQSAASVRAYYLQEGRINALVNVLAEEKALDFLEKASTITG